MVRLDSRPDNQHGLRSACAASPVCVSLPSHKHGVLILTGQFCQTHHSDESIPALLLLHSNVVSIAWNTFLALVAGGGGAKEAQKADSMELPSMTSSGSSPSRNVNALQHELREIKTDKQH